MCGTRGLCCLPDCHLGHGHAQRRRRLRLVRDCFCCVLLWLVCLLLMLACMCVVLRVACCGVLQRRHNSDAVLKRLGSRHECKLTLNWLGTATRNSSSDESLCGHLPVPWTVSTQLNSKLQKKRKNGLQLLSGWRAL